MKYIEGWIADAIDEEEEFVRRANHAQAEILRTPPGDERDDLHAEAIGYQDMAKDIQRKIGIFVIRFIYEGGRMLKLPRIPSVIKEEFDPDVNTIMDARTMLVSYDQLLKENYEPGEVIHRRALLKQLIGRMDDMIRKLQ